MEETESFKLLKTIKIDSKIYKLYENTEAKIFTLYTIENEMVIDIIHFNTEKEAINEVFKKGE